MQLSKGMRLDTSYYYWPPSWVSNVPACSPGSAMPMRFTKLDGEFIDVFMAATQMTDESGQAYPYTIDTLLDRALGAEGYYGAYTVNAHTDAGDHRRIRHGGGFRPGARRAHRLGAADADVAGRAQRVRRSARLVSQAAALTLHGRQGPCRQWPAGHAARAARQPRC